MNKQVRSSALKMTPFMDDSMSAGGTRGDYPLPGSATRQAETLHRATHGRLSRASDVLLQMQGQFGNRHVRRVLQHAQTLTVQPKLTLGEADTAHEREADQIAREVAGGGQITTEPRPLSGTAMPIPPETETAIKQAQRGGEPLDRGTRTTMERSFKADLSGVRLHHDERAHSLNEALNAKAFTTGQDIFFRRGAYDATSSEGQHLLAHELTHTLQQQPQGGLIQRTVWSWTGKEWKNDSRVKGQPDVNDGENVGDKYNDVTQRYYYKDAPVDGSPQERYIETKTQQAYTKDIIDKRDAAGPKLREHRSLNALYKALASNGYNYATVPEEFITRTQEYATFKGYSKKYIKGTAILACRLAMRQIEDGTDLDMEKDGKRLFDEAAGRRSVTSATEGYVEGLHWMQGPDSTSAFYRWLFLNENEPSKNGGTMNCWESVMFGAFKGRAITKDQIVALYGEVAAIQNKIGKLAKEKKDQLSKLAQNDWKNRSDIEKAFKTTIEKLESDWPLLIEEFLVKGTRYEYDPDDVNSPRPLQGDIVFFDSMASHVTLALGNTAGSPQLLSLWNTPNNHYYLQKITVADFTGGQAKGFRRHVYFYRPNW